MGKFNSLLNSGASTIKGVRAALVTETAQFEQEELVRTISTQLRNKKNALVAITDIYPNSTLSLEVVKSNFDAKTWVREIQSLKVEIANLTVELELANETMTEWFGEETPKTVAEKKIVTPKK